MTYEELSEAIKNPQPPKDGDYAGNGYRWFIEDGITVLMTADIYETTRRLQGNSAATNE